MVHGTIVSKDLLFLWKTVRGVYLQGMPGKGLLCQGAKMQKMWETHSL